MAHSTPDVLIVGGGLSGLAAAYRLAQLGRSAVLLEASERLGGRTRGEHWTPAGRAIDLGGTWILPGFTTAHALAAEFALDLVDSPDADLWLTHFSAGITQERALAPAGIQQLPPLAEAITTALAKSSHDLTAAQALADVPVPRRLADWHHATQRYLAGALLTEIDAGHLLIDQAELIDPEHYRTQFADTTRALVDALAARCGADIRLGDPVVAITRAPGAAGWSVRTASGAVLSAPEVILAVPRNLLGSIEFEPALDGALGELAAAPHPGASRKDWFILDGVDRHFRVFASEGPFGYFRSEEILPDGGVLAVGLAPQAEGVPDVAELEGGIRRYLPGATVRAHTRTDWTAEPWARGTWLAPRPGDFTRMLAVSPPSGLHFVGGDLSNDFPGTIEGALATGFAAAERIAS